MCLVKHQKFIFFKRYPELNIEKTSNRLEELFSELKQKLAVYMV